MTNPSFVSLFSGCGGFDLGFIQSGYKCSSAHDIDYEAVNHFRANIGDLIYQCDLREGIPLEHNIHGVDVLIAGPPCQGFSTAGRRDLEDDRNHLLILTGLLAKRLFPKVLVVENVAGALSGCHRKYFDALKEIMRVSGYRTATIKFQTAQLGMAQARVRVLFFAWRTQKEVSFIYDQKSPSTLKDVITGCSRLKNHKPKFLSENSRDWLIAKRIKQGQKLSNVRGGGNAVPTWEIPEVFGQVTQEERTILELLRRLRRRERKRTFGDADPVSLERLNKALGAKFVALVNSLLIKGYLREVQDGIDLVGTFNGKYRRLTWEKPSPTVDTRFGAPRYFLHPTKERGFTVREAARIQGFPDEYIFSGSEKGNYRLIGNAVPPPLAFVASSIANRLLGYN